jgi:RNA polymerase sigma factor (TIGR02999 family)
LAAETVTGGDIFFALSCAGTFVKPEASETTELLLDWAQGNPAALEALTPHIYKELRRMAGGMTKRERPGRTLDATGLVHELYLKLMDIRQADWRGRAHFFAACAQIMRRILVDAARKRSACRHGGRLERLELGDAADVTQSRDSRLIALDDALNELQEVDPRKARVVELRYFGGLSVEETAAALGISVETVTRDWRLARGWLLTQM